jgi:hypothetical protein
MTFEKDKWTGTEYQTPAPVIEVYFPSNTSTSEPDYIFRPDTAAGAWSKLLGYNFSESVEDMEGTFTFTTENGEMGSRSIFDIIPLRSVVKIYEGDNKYPAFVGIIRHSKFNKQMTNQGIKRAITFSGKSIISCIVEYVISLDMRIPEVADAVSKQNELTIRLAEKQQTIKDFMKITWEYFKEVSESAGISTVGLMEIINRYIGDGDPDKFIDIMGEEQYLRYNIACSFFNAGNNVIADVWKNILPKDAYELFQCCKNGEPKIIARQVPFGDPEHNYSDWSNLDLYIISPISLIAYDLDRNDENVYTVFASYIIGAATSREFQMAARQGRDSTVKFNHSKMKIYGFKPMMLTFNGYDRQGNTDGAQIDNTTQAIQKLNELAFYWYSRNDEMYSGTITLITDFRNPRTNPRVGCRARFLGGEFYIKKTDHSWTYGSTPIIKLSVSRGMMYDDSGMMVDGEAGIIKDIGKQYSELERHPTTPQEKYPSFWR